jgi:hypothetical protein
MIILLCSYHGRLKHESIAPQAACSKRSLPHTAQMLTLCTSEQNVDSPGPSSTRLPVASGTFHARLGLASILTRQEIFSKRQSQIVPQRDTAMVYTNATKSTCAASCSLSQNSFSKKRLPPWWSRRNKVMTCWPPCSNGLPYSTYAKSHWIL